MRKTMLAGTMMLVLLSLATIAAKNDNLRPDVRKQLETEIRNELSAEVGVFDNVTFRLNADRSVTLMGQVRQATLKDHAKGAVMHVKGIELVNNQIEILPLSPTDDQLRLALYRAIYSEPGFTRYANQAVPPVHIIVKNGSVALEGVLGNKLEIAQANAAANGVSGIFSVKNNLRIENGDKG